MESIFLSVRKKDKDENIKLKSYETVSVVWRNKFQECYKICSEKHQMKTQALLY